MENWPLWGKIAYTVGVLGAALLLIVGIGKGLENGVKDAANKVKESDWYKEREEKKELERLQRQVLKKRLEDELKQ